jgi:hypothetical protein
MLKIGNIVEKISNASFPAEIRVWEDERLVTVHRSIDTAQLIITEFTSFANGTWENEKFKISYPKVDRTKKIETLVRVKKK